MAGGSSTRWHDYLGIPKHLIRINGETLLERQVRQFHERGITDLIIIGPPERDPRYEVAGASTLFIDDGLQSSPFEQRLFNNLGLWRQLTSSNTRADSFAITLGDVFMSSYLVDYIAAGLSCSNLAWIARKGYDYAGTKRHPRLDWKSWGELWALLFPRDLSHILLTIGRRCIARGMSTKEIYAHVFEACGIPVHNSTCDTPCSHDVDDYTVDFDSPDVYDEWMRMHSHEIHQL